MIELNKHYRLTTFQVSDPVFGLRVVALSYMCVSCLSVTERETRTKGQAMQELANEARLRQSFFLLLL
jgi:hypothetical protein